MFRRQRGCTVSEHATADVERTDAMLSMLILVIAAVLFGVLAWPLMTGQVYVYNDLGYYHLPLRTFYQQCLSSGDSFLWMPSILCGYYVHAEGQAGMCHPLHWMLYRFLPLQVAFNLEFLSAFPFMFAGLYLFLRRWRLQHCTALFGALSFTFSGFSLLHSIHLHMLQVVAHIPWLLLAMDVAWRALSAERQLQRRAWLALALLTASQLLIGFPQAVYFSALAEGGYLLLLLVTNKPNRKPTPSVPSRVFLLAGAKCVAILLAGVQLAPTYDMMLESDRSATPAEFRDFFSLHPANLLQFIGPQFFQRYIGMNPEGPKQPHEAGLYAGVVVILLCWWAVATAARGERLRANALARGAMAMAVLGLILALGRYGGLYPLLAKLPLVSAFRSSCRHIVLVHLGMSILAAVALDSLLVRRQSPSFSLTTAHRQVPAWLMAVPVVAAWGVAAYLVAGLSGRAPLPQSVVPFLSSRHEMGIAPLVMSAAAALVYLCGDARGPRTAALAILVLFSAGDQAMYALHYPSTEKPMTLDAYADAIATPPKSDGTRAYGMVNDLLSVRGIDNCTGYVAPVLNRHFTYEYSRTNLLRLAGVRWADRQWPWLGRPGEWTEIPNPMPYVRMLAKTHETQTPLQDIDKVDMATTALADTPVVLPESEPGSARLIEKRPGNIRVEVAVPARQVLAVAESWHAGWRATADGKELPAMRINGDFLGCVVEPETREVCFRFAPKSIRIGETMTATGVILLALSAVTRFGRRRSH